MSHLLDNGWRFSRKSPQRIMGAGDAEYTTLDFSKREDEGTFNAKFGKLLNGLEIFYKKPEV